MLKILRTLLELLLKDIDTGNTNISEKELEEIILFILKFNSKELSKMESAEYLGISRSTFDKYIKEGKLPLGRKRPGFKELSWNKTDLDKFLENNPI